MTTKIIEDQHLGDGVYASYDGYHIILDLRAQDSTTRIALEPEVMSALVIYEGRVRVIQARILSAQETATEE